MAPVGGAPIAWRARAVKYEATAADLLLPGARSYPSLVERLDRVLVYSGDLDAAVPHSAAEQWTRGLGLSVADVWRPWAVDGAVRGNVITYAGNLTYATVRGAGRRAAFDAPRATVALIRRFLADHPIP